MDHSDQIEVELIKLAGGDRLLRLSHAPLGLVLEKKLDAKQAIARQKARLFGIFEAALAKAELNAA
jgi:hypothetical protein